MLSVLSTIPAKDLLSSIEPTLLKEIVKVSGYSLSDLDGDSNACAKLLLAAAGDNVLENEQIRFLLLAKMSDRKIHKVAQKYLSASPTNTVSACRLLARLPWNAKSRFVYEFAKQFGISRQYLPIASNKIGSIETVDPVEQHYKLFDFQDKLKYKILEELNSACSRFMVQMPTGSGKTKTVWESLVSYINQKKIYERELSTIWLAHTEELCEQSIDTFRNVWQHLGSGTVNIVRVWGSHKVSPFSLYGSSLFCTYQKLNSVFGKNKDFAEVIRESTRFVIADEAHKCLAPTYEKAIKDISKNAILIGLTATPGRSLNNPIQNERLARLFEKKLLSPTFASNSIQELRSKGVLASINHRIIETQFSLGPGNKYEDFSPHVLKAVARNAHRNRLIIEVIKNEIKVGNPVLVFACSTLHSRILAASLNFSGITSAYIDCSMRQSLRRNTILAFKKGDIDVLLNYGVLSTGFDAPNIKTVIIARPTTSPVLYSQMVGRGMRGPAVGGTNSFNLIDLRDNVDLFGDVDDIYQQFDGYWD